MRENPLCPDHTSHSENAADNLFPGIDPSTLTLEQWEQVDAEAENEYLHCEGHC